MTTTIKEMNREQLREIAKGIRSPGVFEALSFLNFLCGSTVQEQVENMRKSSCDGGVPEKISMNEMGELCSDTSWDEAIAKGQKALQFVIDQMPTANE
jgi:hypothetical protein